MSAELGGAHAHPQFVCCLASQLNVPDMYALDCLGKTECAALLAQVATYTDAWHIPFNPEELRAQQTLAWGAITAEGQPRNDESQDAVPADAPEPVLATEAEPASEEDPDPNQMPKHARTIYQGLVDAGMVQGMPMRALEKMSAETVVHINAYVANPSAENPTGALKVNMVLPIPTLLAALSAKVMEKGTDAEHPLELPVDNSKVTEVGTAGAKGFTIVPPAAVVLPQGDAEKEKEEADAEATQVAIEHGGRWCQLIATQGFTKCRALHTQTHKGVAIHATGRRIGRSV
jgi:hypothetical protein